MDCHNVLGGKQPDIVVIVTDQRRSDQFGFASGGHFETPTLDGLAQRDAGLQERVHRFNGVCL
jgi:arylsulfatase A-like enzyme